MIQVLALVVAHFQIICAVSFRRPSQHLTIVELEMRNLVLLGLLVMLFRGLKSRLLDFQSLFEISHLLNNERLDNSLGGFRDDFLAVSVFELSFLHPKTNKIEMPSSKDKAQNKYLLLVLRLLQRSAFSFRLQKVNFGANHLLLAMENLIFYDVIPFCDNIREAIVGREHLWRIGSIISICVLKEFRFVFAKEILSYKYANAVHLIM